MLNSAGAQFLAALQSETPLQLVGVINAMSALLAESAGFSALYLSGAGVANANFGLPDLNFTSLDNVLSEVRKITAITSLPLIVDADTGWGSPLNVRRSIFELERAGAAGAHLEDQVSSKRCGHREGKRLVSLDHMLARLQGALDGRQDPDFQIIARTDALAVEGVEKTLERALAYEASGADILFLEGVTELATYQYFKAQLSIPLLANITEFGVTPMFHIDELQSVGVDIVLYPLGAFRMMNQAALEFYQHIKQEGTQKRLLAKMQTRNELYDLLNYEEYESQLNDYFEGVGSDE